MSKENPPAILQKCACEDSDCPNQVLWINKENLIDYAKDEEVMGCIPIASFKPEELFYLTPDFWEMINEKGEEQMEQDRLSEEFNRNLEEEQEESENFTEKLIPPKPNN